MINQTLIGQVSSIEQEFLIRMAPLDKINALDEIEKEIILCLQSSGQALQELSKEKSSQKNAETQTQQFLKSLSNVESKLSEQINYLTQVSTGQPHEGSGYASAKVLQMAWHRIQHARSRVRELEDNKAKYTIVSRQQQQQRHHQHMMQHQQPNDTTDTSGVNKIPPAM